MASNNPSDPSRLPVITDADREFWDAAQEHELRMQQCNDCDSLRWAPGDVCPYCWSENYIWTELSGRGTVNTWAVFHRPYFSDVEEALPYNVAEIELEESTQSNPLRYISNVVECDNDDIYCGMPVEVVYEDVTDKVTLPKFKPRD
jgi:uncharacterized OB-fold protein